MLAVSDHIDVDAHGVARISGSRVKVAQIIEDHQKRGWSAEQIHAQFPHLPLAKIHAAFVYYYDHPEEIDAAILRNRQEAAAIQSQIGAIQPSLEEPRPGPRHERRGSTSMKTFTASLSTPSNNAASTSFAPLDDGFAATPDERVFQRAIDLNRVLVSQDTDMLILAHQFLKTGHPFTGLLFLNLADLRQHIDSLTYVAESAIPEELANSVWFLPL